MKIINLCGIILSVFLFVSCGGGSSSSSVTPPPITSSNAATGSSAPVANVNTATTPSATQVNLSGKITFDNVPHDDQNFGLDYASTTQMPARGIMVALLNADNEIIKQTITDQNGDYDFTVEPSLDVKIHVLAQLKSPASRDWDVKVTDNTSDNALYVLAGSLSTSGTSASQTRNLNAPSGWGGSSYDSERSAAPFAILNSVYDAIKTIDAVDANASFPELEIRWSPNNRAVVGDRRQGHIGTSSFFRDENVIYLLGEAGRDTDEYDPHVIIHEWGHYFEENLSRLDSMAGLHSLSAKLDPRLAFSEGWCNALAAIVTNDPNYKDSSGLSQNSGFKIDFENLNRSNKGWFNESSVTSIIYDVFDAASDGSDRITGGFLPIYNAVTHDEFRKGDAFTTIFSFSEALLKQNIIDVNDYRFLLEDQSISASNALGTGENNNGSIASSLPVYKEAVVGGEAVQVCSVDDAGNFNRLGNRELVVFDIPQNGSYMISMTLVSGGQDRDPDFNLWQQGERVLESSSSAHGEEVYSGTLSAGRYIAETYDFFNINGNSNRRGDGCFNFQVVTG